MKRYFANMLIAAIACLVSAHFISAQESPENLEKWAKENFEYYSQAPRSEMVKLPLDKMRAIYSMFSPERKAEVWKYKWNDVKKSKHLSKEEKKELRNVYRMVSPEIYEYGDSEADRKFKKASTELEKTLVEEYGWSEDKLFFYCMVALTEAEWKENCRIYGVDFSIYFK